MGAGLEEAGSDRRNSGSGRDLGGKVGGRFPDIADDQRVARNRHQMIMIGSVGCDRGRSKTEGANGHTGEQSGTLVRLIHVE